MTACSCCKSRKAVAVASNERRRPRMEGARTAPQAVPFFSNDGLSYRTWKKRRMHQSCKDSAQRWSNVRFDLNLYNLVFKSCNVFVCRICVCMYVYTVYRIPYIDTWYFTRKYGQRWFFNVMSKLCSLIKVSPSKFIVKNAWMPWSHGF